MPANITSVTVSFGNGIKRDEYGPVKKAEVSFTATVSEDEDGTLVAAFLSHVAIARVAEMLSAPKPDLKSEVPTVASEPQVAETPAVGESPPPRRGRGPNKPKAEPAAAEPVAEEPAPSSEQPSEAVPEKPAEDEWASSADDIAITDQEILSATSKRAGELGARDPIIKLIATFATRTEGPPFKVQEIPQAQRKDYLAKLAALTA